MSSLPVVAGSNVVIGRGARSRSGLTATSGSTLSTDRMVGSDWDNFFDDATLVSEVDCHHCRPMHSPSLP